LYKCIMNCSFCNTLHMCFDLREKDIDDLGWSDRAHG